MVVHVVPQRTCPAAHGARQAPLTHVVEAEHGCPHVPQLRLSLLRLLQTAPQNVLGAGQPPSTISMAVHVPPAQTIPLGHTVLHVMQLFGSTLVSTHALPHMVSADGHEVMHWPPLQVALP
jgi:hypothetical protein